MSKKACFLENSILFNDLRFPLKLSRPAYFAEDVKILKKWYYAPNLLDGLRRSIRLYFACLRVIKVAC